MILKRIFLFCLVSLAILWHTDAQDSAPDDAIKARWLRSQPVIVSYSRSGVTTTGQQIHLDKDSLYIYPASGIPVGPDWYDKLLKVSLNDVDHVLLQKGGNRYTRDKRAVSYKIPDSFSQLSESIIAIRDASVYRDSLVNPPDLDEAFSHSKVLRRAFPRKHVRISFGLGFGGNGITDDMEEAVEGTPLPTPYTYRDPNVSAELLDISVRLYDRFIIGGQLHSQFIDAYANGYASSPGQDINYDYSVQYTEHIIYAEYAILNTDRYFARNIELIAGVGLLLSKPYYWFSYSYYNHEDPDNPLDSHSDYSSYENLQGWQLRSAFHYYFLRGFSLWTGLNVNLYPPYVIPAMELPVPGEGENIIVHEHGLGFSSVRFKLGLSFYF